MIQSYFNNVAEKIELFTEETDTYNEPILKEIARDVKCRFIEQEKLIKKNNSEEIVSSAEIQLDPSIQKLKQRSIITINGRDYKVEKSGFVYGLINKKYQRVFVS
jgi:hypothetical protein